MAATPAIALAFVGGFIPALFWLWFWLREDAKHPEPKSLIILTFVLGMAAVPLAFPLEQYTHRFTENIFVIFIIWAVIEELLKNGAAYLGSLREDAMDEPVDPVIYMITAALGFAALENTLFLLGPDIVYDFTAALITTNVRFIGATLLHVVSSACIGASISFAFHKKKEFRLEYFLIGFTAAVALHALFNYFIIQGGAGMMFVWFGCIWILVIALILLFERIKTLHA
jgi:protease PrsW